MSQFWEYRIMRVVPNEKGGDELTRRGHEGWRVISLTNPGNEPAVLTVVLERPYIEPRKGYTLPVVEG